MDHKKIIKFLKITGLIFISVSILELAFFITLNFTVFNLNGNSILLAEFIYGSSYVSLTGTILWLIFIITIVVYSILGFFILTTAKVNKIESKSLAKLMVVVGMVSLLGALIKMNYFVLLGKTLLYFPPPIDTISFQAALYSPDITPLLPAILWIYSMSVNCFYMIISIIITSLGIRWTLDIEKLESKEKKRI